MFILESDSFSGSLPSPQETGVSPIFKGKIKVLEDSLRCYIKPFNTQIKCPVTKLFVSNKEHINEALGHTIAKTSGLPVADTAGIIILRAEQIPENVKNHLFRESGNRQPAYVCWFSQDMLHPSIKSKHLSNITLPKLKEKRQKRIFSELKNNSQCAKLIAFDEWLANSDRNLGNILEGKKGSLILIDHGRILNYPNWQAGHLGLTNNPPKNVIKDGIEYYNPGWTSLLPTKSKQILAFNGFSVSFSSSGEQHARDVLSKFLDHREVNLIVDLLIQRLNSSSGNASAGVVV